MKKIKICLLLLLSCLCFSKINYFTSYASVGEQYYLGGYPAIFSLDTRGACVVGLCDVVDKCDVYSPSKDAKIEVGDIILSIDGINVNNAQDVATAIKNGGEKLLKVKRGEISFFTKIKPAKDNSGMYKLGVFIKDGISGVGTITYFTKDEIGCLGHPVLDDNGKIMDITGGKVYNANIIASIKGVIGRPGELRGAVNSKDEIAKVYNHSLKGIFGKRVNDYNNNLKEIEIGKAQMGDAFIYSTIFGNTPKQYSISIVKCDSSREDKNFVVKITDDELLENTNGIVQGMSGSPIVQNGKLVGAITHVFTNDPTRGFGIDINNMINR